MHTSLRITTLFDLPIVCERKKTVLHFLFEHLKTAHRENSDKKSDSLLVIATPNPEQVVQSRENTVFKNDLLEADLLLPDGIGLVIASRLLTFVRPVTLLPERIAGVDIAIELLAFAKKEQKKVLVIGGRGYHSYFSALSDPEIHWNEGYASISKPTEIEESEIKKLIQKTQPKIVFVAFGAPFQEKWLKEHRELLEKNGVKVAMAVGGAFDMVSGQVPRAPEWLRRVGGEWIFRLVQQPWRWRRQLRLLTFVKLLVQELLK